MTTSLSHNRTAAAIPSTAPAAAKRVFKLLQRMTHGQLSITLPDHTQLHFGVSSGLHAHIKLSNWNMFGAALKSGDIGFAETYIAGDWHTPDLTPLLQVLLQNRKSLEDAIYGHWVGRLFYQVRHWMNRNTQANSRKNIHAHYDLGNDFYKLWLDPSMNYSSALFETQDQTLTQAQHAKVRRALEMAGVTRGSRVLEIGCGWGALADMAANDMGAEVVGLTLSDEQLAWAQQRLANTPNASHTDLRLQDYRSPDVTKNRLGEHQLFDAVCSIEMIEAVGQSYWPTYFQTIAASLRDGGKACIQAIVIRDELFERYIQGTDFIQQYVFPGGCLPSPAKFTAQAQAAGLEVTDSLAFGLDYANTLAQWRATFVQQEEAVRALGFDTAFIRTWEFYLCYCEAAFLEGNTDVVQFTLRKPSQPH
jgi:cyclopropane-fatty-acyl-phospholipid synthase